MRTTIADIAKETGLREGTISRALSPEGKYRVSSETRKRVEAAASRLGYRPNFVGRALAAGSSGLLCFLSPSPYSAHYGSVARELSRFTGSAGYSLLPDAGTEAEPNAAPTGRREWRYGVDGIVAFDPAPWHGAYLDEARRLRIPTIVVGSCAREGADSIIVDVHGPARKLVRHLIERGCKSIAMLAPGSLVAVGTLTSAYRAELKSAGLPEMYLHAEDYRRSSGREAILRAQDIAYDALICTSDELALGAYKGLLELGRRIPADVALAGCDGIDDALLNHIPVTSLVQPVAEICSAAWDLLRERLDGSEGPSRIRKMSASLEIRESTAGHPRLASAKAGRSPFDRAAVKWLGKSISRLPDPSS